MFNKPIEEMDFKELRNAVQVLYDAYEIQRRALDDILQNLGVENFSGVFRKKLGDMSTSIEQTAEAIKLTATKKDLNETAQTIYAQTADAIATSATKQFDLSLAEEAESTKKMTDIGSIYFIAEYDGDGNETSRTYYYYNNIEDKWMPIEGNSIFTIFRQTASGFEFIGNVAIDGNLITKGTISAQRIDTDNLSCTKLYSKSGKQFAKMNSAMGDFGVFLGTADEEDLPNNETCIWGMYHSDPNAGIVDLRFYGNAYLEYSNSQKYIYPKGTWDFANATVENMGLPLVFG